VITKVAQEQVANFVNENNVDVVLVRAQPRYVKTLSMLVGLKLLVVAA
jgi:hypothetical protein